MKSITTVKVVEDCRVAPPPGSGVICLPLTFYDIFWLRFPPNQRLFFYELPSNPNSTTNAFYETILPKLKKSLSITLQHYLPVAGNIIWEPDSEKPVLQTNSNDSVWLTVVESSADFHHLSSDDFRLLEELHPFLPDFPVAESKVPVFTLRLTLFPSKGFSIGYASHHAAMDGKSTAMFMDSWASICRHGDYTSSLAPELVPFYVRSIVKDPEGKESNYLKAYLEHEGPNNRSLVYWEMKPSSDIMLGTFHVSEENIKKLKKIVLTRWKEKNVMEDSVAQLSTFTVVSAYIWVCLARSQKIEVQKVHLAMSSDCRARSGFDPPIPHNYFGNCLAGVLPEINLEDLIGEDGVALASKAIVDALKQLKVKITTEAESSDYGLFSMPRGAVFSMAGSPRFKHYKVDFGWGKSKKVELVSIGKNRTFSLSDPRNCVSGLDIGVAIKQHEAKAFADLFGNSFGQELN